MKKFIQIHKNITYCKANRFVAAVGVFDGVHLGHQQIIRRAAARAQESNAKVLALSFAPHPRQLICPDNAPPLLLTVNERLERLLACGADLAGLIDFTKEVAALSPEDFLKRVQSQFNICGICVGSNWRFGRKGSGDRAFLEKFCRENHWSLDAVPEVELDGVIISSSEIRQAAARGDLEYAAKMLGRGYQLTGIVEHGFHIATEKLAAPTANLRVTAGVMVPDGVYSGTVELDGKSFPAALNIGVAPTFGNDLHRVEIHLIGFDGTLYGRELDVTLHRFLRAERRFASPDELKAQIACDIKNIMQDQRL